MAQQVCMYVDFLDFEWIVLIFAGESRVLQISVAWCLSNIVCQPAEDCQGHQRNWYPDTLIGDDIPCQLCIYTPKWHNHLNWTLDKIPSVCSVWIENKPVDWCIPPSPHSHWFNVSKSMGGGEQMYMSRERTLVWLSANLCAPTLLSCLLLTKRHWQHPFTKYHSC